MVEVYVRGNSIKYITIPEEVLDMVQEEDLSKESKCTSLSRPVLHRPSWGCSGRMPFLAAHHDCCGIVKMCGSDIVVSKSDRNSQSTRKSWFLQREGPLQ